MLRVYRSEGLVGFFKGNGTNLVRMLPYTAIQFAVYESLLEVGVRILCVFRGRIRTVSLGTF